MVGKLVLRGLIVGILAGLLAFAVAKTFAEPVIGVAINFESAQDEAERAAQIAKGIAVPPEEPDMFSRDIQTGIGLFTGVVSVGVGIGAIFSIMFAFANGRMGTLGPKSTAALIALIAIVTVYVVPALKYPANPPAVGQPDTIKLRTGVYFLMIALSVISTFGGLWLRKRLIPSLGAWNASMVAFGAYFISIVAWYLLLPHINEVPSNFPAVILWRFRIWSLATQIVLWGGTGIMFGYAAERLVSGRGSIDTRAAMSA